MPGNLEPESTEALVFQQALTKVQQPLNLSRSNLLSICAERYNYRCDRADCGSRSNYISNQCILAFLSRYGGLILITSTISRKPEPNKYENFGTAKATPVEQA